MQRETLTISFIKIAVQQNPISHTFWPCTYFSITSIKDVGRCGRHVKARSISNDHISQLQQNVTYTWGIVRGERGGKAGELAVISLAFIISAIKPR